MDSADGSQTDNGSGDLLYAWMEYAEVIKTRRFIYVFAVSLWTAGLLLSLSLSLTSSYPKTGAFHLAIQAPTVIVALSALYWCNRLMQSLGIGMGNHALAVVLHLFFVIPGIVYTLNETHKALKLAEPHLQPSQPA